MIGSNNRQDPCDPQAENDALRDRLADDIYAAFMSRPPLARPGWKYSPPPRPSLPTAPDNLSVLRPAPFGASQGYTPPGRSEDAEAFASRRMTLNGDLNDPATRANYNAARETLRSIYERGTTNPGEQIIGPGGVTTTAQRALNDLQGANVHIGPSPRLWRKDESGRPTYLGAATYRDNEGRNVNVYIDPGDRNVAGSLELYGPAAGANYNAGHEIVGHGLFDSHVPGVASNGRREAYANSFAGEFARRRGVPYPSNEQLRDRGGWALIPPWPSN